MRSKDILLIGTHQQVGQVSYAIQLGSVAAQGSVAVLLHFGENALHAGFYFGGGGLFGSLLQGRPGGRVRIREGLHCFGIRY